MLLLPITDPNDCMQSAYSYLGIKDVTAHGQQCIPWVEIGDDEGIEHTYILNTETTNVQVLNRELISGFSDNELTSMGQKCRYL